MPARRYSSVCGCRTVGYKWVAPCAEHTSQFQETQDSTWKQALALPPLDAVDSQATDTNAEDYDYVR